MDFIKLAQELLNKALIKDHISLSFPSFLVRGGFQEEMFPLSNLIFQGFAHEISQKSSDFNL